jgi:polar amino acid transport system substrate-binding protein
MRCFTLGLESLLSGLAILALSITAVEQAYADGDSLEISVVTEQFPPYNYEENGEIIGLSTQVVQAVFDDIGIPFVPKVVPWVRALIVAENSTQTLIYSIGRIPERESRYQWVGVIAPAKNYLFKHAQNHYINISTLEEAKAYRIVTFKESVRENYLEGKGFKKGKHLVSVYNYQKALKLFSLQKVELWSMNEFVAHYHVKKAGLKVKEVLKPMLLLDEISPEGYYMAFGNAADKKIVERFKKSLKNVKDKGIYQKIMDNFLNSDT